jgi:F0F1-type ATP synthase assembly protein I
MPEPDKSSREAFRRLDERLASFEASRRTSPTPLGLGGSASQGYRAVSLILGGVLGGLGFGWLFDSLAHTRPLGTVVGLLAGSGFSMFALVRAALQANAKADPAPPSVVDDDDDD